MKTIVNITDHTIDVWGEIGALKAGESREVPDEIADGLAGCSDIVIEGEELEVEAITETEEETETDNESYFSSTRGWGKEKDDTEGD